MVFQLILEPCSIAYIDLEPNSAFDFEESLRSYFAKTAVDTAASVLGFLGIEALVQLAFAIAEAYPCLASCLATCGWDISHYFISS
jgi:hypothetical protein